MIFTPNNVNFGLGLPYSCGKETQDADTTRIDMTNDDDSEIKSFESRKGTTGRRIVA